jgi:ABC-type transport system substrate-binding protein
VFPTLESTMRCWILVLLTFALAFGQTVEESFTRDPGLLDLIRGEGHEQAILQALTADALVGVDTRGRPVPRLALRWEIQPWGLRFHLRKTTFADGSPLRPEDVLWTFREIQASKDASPSKRSLLQDLTFSVRGQEVEVRCKRPPERLLLELARVPIAKEMAPAMGSGPYQLQRSANEWRFQARAHFLQPKIPAFRFRLVPEPQAILHWLKKGWLSLGVPPPRAGGEPPASHREVIQPTHAQLVVWCKGSNHALHWMERWRKDAFPPALLARSAVPSRGLWPETLGFEPVALSGSPADAKGQRWELLHVAGDEFVIKLLLALRERARKDGVTLDLRPIDPALLYDRLQRGEFQLACALALFDPHPWSVLEYLEPAGPMNFTGWSHPALANLLPAAKSPRAPAWNELQRLWAGSAAALPLIDYKSVVWVDRRLNLEPSPLGLYLTTPGPAGWSWAK